MNKEIKNKRKAISIETKYEIIKKHEAGAQPKDLVREYNLANSTISTIFSFKEKIVEQYESNIITSKQKRLKTSKYPELEDALDFWFNQAISKTNVTIDCDAIKAQAIKYATFLQIHDFQASNGWLEKYKKRHNISIKTICGEAGLVDSNVIQNWLNNIFPDLIKGYSEKDIFNADETALFFKALPTKTLCYKDMDCNSVKISKERLSILLAANWEGSEKLKPVVIGKYENPRCFKSVNKANLPVYYRNNPKAWMNEKIFQEWLNKLNQQMKMQNRKILLFLDNFAGHSSKKDKEPYNLSNIKIAYFPPNCTSVVQPMDQGIIQSFKLKYRKFVVQRTIDCIDYGYELPQITILESIDFIQKAWRGVTSTTINKCFRKAGFCLNMSLSSIMELNDLTEENESLNDYHELWKQLNEKNKSFDFNHDIYLEIDKDLSSSGILTDEEIISQVIRGTESRTDQESDNEDTETETKKYQDWKQKGLEIFKLYCLQNSNDSKILTDKLEEIEELEEIFSAKVKKQASILSYFK